MPMNCVMQEKSAVHYALLLRIENIVGRSMNLFYRLSITGSFPSATYDN